MLSRGGNVLRLAGLYTATRGPHAYWLHKTRDAVTAGAPAPVMPGAADALVNMLHYEDAAGAVIALIAKPGDLTTRLIQYATVHCFKSKCSFSC